MGMPGSGLLLSEKDLNDKEFNILSLPTLEFQENIIGCQVAASEDLEGDQQRKEEDEKDKQRKEEDRKGEVGCSMENMKRACLGQLKDDVAEDEDEDEDGFRTPPTLENRIPLLVPQCPPAPRKPKSLPLLTKRKTAHHHRVVLLDLSKEIEALFPPALLADLGGKIKKVRKEIGTN